MTNRTPGILGAAILRHLEAWTITQVELAKRMDRPYEQVNRLIHGVIGLTPANALRLEKALHVGALYWMTLDAEERLQRERERPTVMGRGGPKRRRKA